MRSVVSLEEGISASLFDSSISSGGPMASVVCDEKLEEAVDVKPTAEDIDVSLPPRYKLRLLSTKGRDITSQSSAASQHKQGDDLDSREKDLGVALKWIRQEILQMKEQDKSLLKQFIDLRASILQLRCMYEYHSSNSDVSSIEGSTASLNDTYKSRRKLSVLPGGGDCDFLGLSSRARSLLNLPGSSNCTRIKWKSDEYI